MECLRRGDADAFEALYDRYADRAFALAARVCGCRVAPDDVVQDAFLSIWRSSARYDASRGSVQTFLLAIVRNRAIDAIRRAAVHQRGRADADGWEEPFVSPTTTHDEAVTVSEATAVRAAMSELPAPQRLVIELGYFAGLTQREIAAVTDVPLGTVKGRARLALVKLTTQLEGAGLAAAGGV